MRILFFFLQPNVNQAANQMMTHNAGELKMPYMELLILGGWLMVPIILLSFVAVYIFVERLYAVRKASQVDINFMNRIKDYIHDGKIESALALCESFQHPAARMIEKGIHRIGRPLNDVNVAIENVGKLEIYKLERGLPLMATVAGGAPMIGFLGTVVGMVKSFYNMSMAGNNIDVSVLSNGIYTALITTVGGLIVGIAAYFAYNILVARIEKLVYQLEGTTIEFMDLLNEPVKG
jgi:biopolymer transport protein ExbB